MKLDDLATAQEVLDTVAHASPMHPTGEPANEEEEVFGARFRTAAQLSRETPAKVEWLAWPMAARGTMALLSGLPKLAGKTTLVLRMVAAVLDGLPWLGVETQKTPVVYLTEEPDTSFRVALERAGLTDREDLHVLSKHHASNCWKDSVVAARRKAKRVGAKLIIIDTYAEWTEMISDGENTSGNAITALAPLKAGVAQDSLAVLVIAHDRKSGGDIGLSTRGSNALPGGVETIINMRQGKEKTERNLDLKGRLDVPDSIVLDRLPDGSYVAKGSTELVAKAQLEVDARSVEERLLAVAPEGQENAITRSALMALRPDTISEHRWLDALDRVVDSQQLNRAGAGHRSSPYSYWRPLLGEPPATGDASGSLL